MTDTNIDTPAEAVSPSGINHLVLNVRDIDEFAQILDRNRRLQAGRRAASEGEPAEPAKDAVLQRR